MDLGDTVGQGLDVGHRCSSAAVLHADFGHDIKAAHGLRSSRVSR
jgi:hypothetical protein